MGRRPRNRGVVMNPVDHPMGGGEGWLRMNASYRLNTCKSRGSMVLACYFVVERRNRTIHKRMREYLFELTHKEGLLTSVVPLGDGIAITMKSHEKREETT